MRWLIPSGPTALFTLSERKTSVTSVILIIMFENEVLVLSLNIGNDVPESSIVDMEQK